MSQANLPNVHDRLREILSRTLMLSPEEQASLATLRMGTHPRWNSLTHMGLIVELEKQFKITIPPYQIAQLNSYEAIEQTIAKQLKGAG